MKTMAPLNVAVLLFLGIQSSALTTEFKMNGAPKHSKHLTGEVCEDCSEIFNLVVDILTNADIQRKMMDNLEVLCDYLPNPGRSGQICRQQVEQILPIAINFITNSVQPEQVCSFLGLCGSHLEDGHERKLIIDIQESVRAAIEALDLSDMPWAGEDSKLTGASSIQCTYCLVIMDALQKMFPKEKTEAAVVDIMLAGCGLLPASYTDKCEALVDSFVKTVLDTLLSHITPKTICSLVQLCSVQERALNREAFVDPCTVQSFRCRDLRNAVRCGTVSFCQRFAWKSARKTLFRYVG
ncbi:prosaposin [Gadus chalcogrammus]|uniref:prosaposin n=1 Tax=Gadus chalcogrammus TaxID=1042646 RepID=UPI0024C25C86|nr:prosaposin [Gadus chalcogrammus]